MDPIINPAMSALPGSPVPSAPLQPDSGFSFSSMFVFAVFGYALYQIGRRYLAQRRFGDFNKQYREKDFADGFL